jgi:hypothetical protein
MTHWHEQQEFVRNCKGAAASILLIMLFSGRSLTNRDLQQATGYSDKPVTDALGWLEPRGIVHYVSQADGWTLGPGLARLPFSPLQLADITRLLTADGVTEALSAAPARLTAGDKRPLSRSRSERPAAATHSSNADHTDNEESDSRRLSAAATGQGVSGRPSDSGIEDRKYSDLGAEDRNISDLAPPIVVVVDQDQKLKNKKTTTTNNQQLADRKYSDLADFLQRVGVRGRAYRRILAEANGRTLTLARAWWWEARCNPGLINPAGYLICRLADGHEPTHGFMALSGHWPDLSADQRDELHVAATGRDNGRVLHAGISRPNELRYWLGEDFPDLPDAALAAYLQLAKAAAEEVTR